jgi:uncharacterized membrane-anchored protein
MKNILKNFSFPFKTQVLILSPIILFGPTFVLGLLPIELIRRMPDYIGRGTIFLTSFLGTIGFIYCTLGYHFQILRGDELKLKIHLESLNIAFTTTLVFLFALIFVFLNFAPTMLNYILVILSVIAIIAYVLGTEFIKEKYE